MKRNTYRYGVWFLLIFCLQLASPVALAASQLRTSLSPLSGSSFAQFVISADGTLYGWGDDMYHTVRDPGVTHTVENPHAIMKDTTAVFAEMAVVLAIDADKVLWGWGNNLFGQLGTSENSEIPAGDIVRIMDNVVYASVGMQHCLAIKTDGTLWAWGMNTAGQLGNGSSDRGNGERLTYSPIKIMDDVKFIYAYGQSNFAVKRDGSLWTWGADILGISSYKDLISPVQMMKNTDAVAVGDNGLYILKDDSTLWQWTNFGKVFNASDLSPLMNDIGAVGNEFAVSLNGTLWAWGDLASRLELDAGKSTPCKVATDIKYAIRIPGAIEGIRSTGELMQLLFGETEQSIVMNNIMQPEPLSNLCPASDSSSSNVINKNQTIKFIGVGFLGVISFLTIIISIRNRLRK